MDPGEPKISVWLCREEKLVSGLSKRTTCADVVRALLAESRRRGRAASASASASASGGMLGGPPEGYCLVETWRGLERALPAKTRLLRLWGAWGAERENVRFVLLRAQEAPAPPRSAQARVVPSRERRGPRGGAQAQPRPRPRPALSQERQRRVVRKAFRKLAQLKRGKGGQEGAPTRAPSPPPSEEKEEEEGGGSPSAAASRMERLVHLVLAQDHTLRQQGKRLRELDREIERYEARVHLERMRRHGVNYVQETYLEGGAPEEEEEEAEEEEEGSLAAWARRRGAAVAALAEERARQEALGESLAAQIQEELNRRWMRRRRQELAAASSAPSSERDPETTELSGGGEQPLPVEEERLRTQLSTSLYIGLRLSTDLDAVRDALEDTRRAWREKESQIQGLLLALRGSCQEGDGAPSSSEPWRPPEEEEEEEEEEEALGKADREENDDDDGGEDSDTGLSSMHSQDSDSGPSGVVGGGPCESLV